MRQINWDVVALGRVLGALVILIGTGLAAWAIIDTEGGFIADTADKIRYFLQFSLSYWASGGLLIVAAEIADRLGWGGREEPPGEEAALAPTDAAQ